MKKLAVAAVLYLLHPPISYSMGLFHRHHDDPQYQPPRNFQSAVSPAPEPETYILCIVGLVVVGWVIRNRDK
jgi:hypothetical protein